MRKRAISPTAGYGKGVPMGGDLKAARGRQGADLPGRGAEGSGRRQPRPHPDRQGLGRREGRAPGEGLRRRLVGRSQARRRRQAAGGRQHRRRRQRRPTPTRIGAPQLSAAWKDPEFDPALRAVYYVRVLEIPTPRWTAYDAMRFNVKMPQGSADDRPRSAPTRRRSGTRRSRHRDPLDAHIVVVGRGDRPRAVNAVRSSVDIDASIILDHLKMTGMSALAIQKGHWGAFTDVVYLNVGDSTSQTRQLEIRGNPLPSGSPRIWIPI